MTDSTNQHRVPARLRCGIVVRVREDACEIARDRQLCSVRYATPFPSPRTERVSPGHLVAIATAPDGTEAVVWRWHDAVVLGAEAGLIRLWEPSHGEVLARPRPARQSAQPGTRAYLSAGLPAPTGGPPAAPLPARRTPTSSWTRSSSSTPSAISGTPWYEIRRTQAPRTHPKHVPHAEPSTGLLQTAGHPRAGASRIPRR